MADLGLAAKTRAVVIVSRYDPDPPRALVLYVPLTTQNRHSPYEVALPKLPFLNRGSVANVQGLGSLPKVRLERRLGRLPDEVMGRIKCALLFALDLGTAGRPGGSLAGLLALPPLPLPDALTLLAADARLEPVV